MTENEILAELKKATDLWMDKTYTVSEFYSHTMSIIREAVSPHLKHQDQLERLIFRVDELRENQRLYHGGHKQLYKTCLGQEADIDKKIMHLQTMGYSIQRFKQAKPIQNTIFD